MATDPLPRPTDTRYELHHDQLEETYTIRKVQNIGPFASREEARQYMIDTAEQRFAEHGNV